MEHWAVFLLFFRAETSQRSAGEEKKGAQNMNGDKLCFIVSYSEIVCNKIYVLITQEKLQENCWSLKGILLSIISRTRL